MLGRRILLKVRYQQGGFSQNSQSKNSITAKAFFKIYQKAIQYTINNDLQKANNTFRECLNEISLSKEDYLEHYAYILKKMAHNHRRLGQNKLAEERLYEVIKNKRNQQNASTVLVYEDYNNLFKHLITYDLEKAAKLCKALLIKQKQEMPVSHTKMFNMNLGIVYLLSGNYEDAKKRFSQCLQADPQGKIKTYALNNLGLACWWHKNPFQSSIQTQASKQNQKINRDYKKATQMFNRSLRESQKFDRMQDQLRKFMLDQTLSLNTEKLQDKLYFDHQESLFPLFNLAEFFIANDPIQRAQIIYWYSRAMALSKKVKNDKMFDRIYIEYSILNSQVKELEEKLPLLIEKNRYSQQFSEQSYYCRILAKILRNQKKIKEAIEFEKRSQTIDSILPVWTQKLRHIAYEQLNLTS